HRLPAPFSVLATQNPIELEGTFPLPEAQLDRFMFKLRVPFPERTTLRAMLDVSLDAEPADTIEPIAGPDEVLRIGALARRVLVGERCKAAAVDLVASTQPVVDADVPDDAGARRHIRYGASPRALQALVRAARVRALIDGRAHVDVADLEAVALPVLRHRVLLRLESELDGVDADGALAAVIEGWRSRL
ncbi:MAG: MoxR family ATPase, partial [Burkholderiales bacterium]|nr:MoxR family ATPase [Burkholderiales bacterium]